MNRFRFMLTSFEYWIELVCLLFGAIDLLLYNFNAIYFVVCSF